MEGDFFKKVGDRLVEKLGEERELLARDLLLFAQ